MHPTATTRWLHRCFAIEFGPLRHRWQHKPQQKTWSIFVHFTITFQLLRTKRIDLIKFIISGQSQTHRHTTCVHFNFDPSHNARCSSERSVSVWRNAPSDTHAPRALWCWSATAQPIRNSTRPCIPTVHG